MNKIKVNVINKSNNPLPEAQTIGSAGLDLKAYITTDISNTIVGNTYLLYSNCRIVLNTGIYVKIPIGYEIQMRGRSGLAAKHGISVLNSPATIDSDYTGEIKVILHNHSSQPYEIKNGDRVAQILIKEVLTIDWNKVSELEKTDRGTGGFGHTGS